MRRFILMMLLSVVSSCAMATSDPVKKFEAFLMEAEVATNTKSSVRPIQGGWRKYRYAVNDVKYDVTKTNSLVSPIIGTVSFYLRTEVGEKYSSQEEADTLTTFDSAGVVVDEVSITYSFNNEKWRINKATYKNILWGKATQELKKADSTTRAFEITEKNLMDAPYKYWTLK